jgi:aerobic-type carbon monoxide dehydrogenase small subunit (CoxS/CutS family)
VVSDRAGSREANARTKVKPVRNMAEVSVTKNSLKFVLNNEEKRTEVAPSDNLLDTLRDTFGTMSVKRGCDYGGCGMCTVLLDGKPVYSCMTPSWKASGKRVETIEGVNDGGKKIVGGASLEDRLSALQKAFVKNFAQQCGYCTPAMILNAKALLSSEPKPSVEKVKDSISGVLCRCTGYMPIVEAIMEAANAQTSRE